MSHKLARNIDKTSRFSDIVEKLAVERATSMKYNATREFKTEYKAHLLALRRMYFNVAEEIEHEIGAL